MSAAAGTRRRWSHLLGVLWVMPLLACAGQPPAGLGVRDGQLAACPGRPNCVASDAADPAHAIAPLAYKVPDAAAWAALLEVLGERPRTTVVAADDSYLHAACRSRLFGFTDDLEFHLRPATKQIAVRSAARLGYSDFGVNRRRVEAIRAALRARDVL